MYDNVGGIAKQVHNELLGYQGDHSGLIKRIQELYDELFANMLVEAWGYYKYGSYWEDYGSSPIYEQKIKSGEIKREISEKEKHIAMAGISESYFLILKLCEFYIDSDDKFRAKMFKTAIRMSEQVQMYENAYNLARCAVETKHGRSWFREAINRNKGKKDTKIIPETILIDLEEMTEFV